MSELLHRYKDKEGKPASKVDYHPTPPTPAEDNAAWLRAAAGWLRNYADSIDEKNPEFDLVHEAKDLAKVWEGAQAWADSEWSSYL